MAKKKKIIKTSVYKSAKTGRFVRKGYAKKNKNTTFKETVKREV